MHILILSDTYVPEIAASSFRESEHAARWIADGHEVTVVTCCPNWPHGRPFDGYENKAYQEETLDGVRVIRLGTYMASNTGFAKRIADYLSYAFAVGFWSWRLPKPDVIVATSPQFFTALAGWGLSVVKRRPWIFEVRDLWPDSIKAVGASQGRVKTALIDGLETLELFLYRRADRCVVVTDPFRENLTSRGIDPGKIRVVTNGVNCAKFDPENGVRDVRPELGLGEDDRLAGYIGTTGMAHGLGHLLDAAAELRDDPRLKILIMGEGAERCQLEQLAEDRGLHNVIFRDRVPREEVSAYYRALDVALVHLKPDPLFKTVIPSKIFEFMAMRLPILMAGEGEGARIVTESGAGRAVPSGDSGLLAQTLREMLRDEVGRERMGRAGRKSAEEEFSRDAKAAQMMAVLRELVPETAEPMERRRAA